MPCTSTPPPSATSRPAGFGLMLPLLAMIHGIATGSRAIAGEEESGQLDLLLAHPVTRTALALQPFGALATGLGAVCGRRVVVLAATVVIGVLAYAAHTFAAQIGAGWLAYLSPFHYYIDGEPLTYGFQWGDAAVLGVAAVAFVALGAIRFGRRDLNN